MNDQASRWRWFVAGLTRVRITVVATLVASAILVPAGLLGYSAVVGAQQDAAQSTALAQAQGMAGLLNEAVLPENYQGDLPFQVSTEDGRVLATSGNLIDFQAQGAIGADGWAPLGGGDGFPFRETTLLLEAPEEASNRLNGLTLGTIDTYTRIGAPEAAATGVPLGTTARVLVVMTPTDTHDLQTLLTVAVPAAILVLAVSVWFSVGSALHPITQMSHQVNTITDAPLGQSIPVPRTGDEVQELAVTLNSLLARLGLNDAAQRAFLDDAAHELRSPITSLLTTLEVAERYPSAVDWTQTLAAATRQARRLQLLADDLLLLTRLEADPGDDVAPVDLGELVTQVAGTMTFRHALLRELDQGVTVRAHQRDLARLVRNLFDNANRHARTTITVTLSRSDSDRSKAVLTISNDGEPIPAGMEERIFDRLVRIDSARDKSAGGTGLGLAIARQIAHNHNATLDTAPRTQGAEFRLTIPLPTPKGREG